MLIRLILILFFIKCLFLQAQTQLENLTRREVLTSNQITCYFVDSKGIVWLGTEAGLNAYSAGNWYPISSITNNNTGKDEQFGRIEKIYEDRNRTIWVSTNNGIFVYNGKFWVHFLQEEDENFVAKDFLEDRNGRIWLGFEYKKEFKEISNLQVTMVSGIVYMYNYELWYRFAEMSGNVALKYNVPPKYFTAFLLDNAGCIWVSSLEGLFRFKDEKLLEIENDDLKLIKNFSILQGKSGDIWVASEKGIFRLNEDKWLNYNKKDGLNGEFFYDIEEDPTGNIWAFSATDMKFTGLNMFDGKYWQQFDNDAIHLKGTVEKLIWHEDEVLAFSSNGVSKFDSTAWHRFDKQEGLSEKSYSLIVVDRNKNIWLAGSKGFYQYNNKKWIKLFEPIEEWDVNEIIVDKKGILWIATESSGVYKYSDDNWEQMTVENGLPDNDVSSIFEDKKGEIWVITKKGIAKTNFLTQ